MVDVTSAPYLRDTIAQIVFMPGNGYEVMVSRNEFEGLAEMSETKQAKKEKRMIHDPQTMTLSSAEACDMLLGRGRSGRGTLNFVQELGG